MSKQLTKTGRKIAQNLYVTMYIHLFYYIDFANLYKTTLSIIIIYKIVLPISGAAMIPDPFKPKKERMPRGATPYRLLEIIPAAFHPRGERTPKGAAP